MGEPRDDRAEGSDATSVFLSYARGDRPLAQKIVEALKAEGFTVWWDDLISGGHEFSERIEQALAAADAVVVLWSPESTHSHWVRDEAGYARDRNRLVPAVTGGCEAPLGFRQLHHIDLAHWHGKSTAPEFQQLCQSIRAVAGLAPLPDHKRSATVALTRRHAIVGGGVAALAAGGLLGWNWLHGSPAEASSIAVLPFQNLSGDPKDDYFSDGMAEELRATLSQAEQLQVAAQTSSDTFRDGKSDARKMAKALGVAFLVEGSVRRSPDTIRVSTRIVDGQTGFDKWSQSFDRKLTDSLAVQSDIAAFVTDALLADLDKEKRPAERIGGTKQPEAFDNFLRGTSLYRMAGGQQSDEQALAQFDKALALDPSYAAAEAARSRVLTVIANNYISAPDIPAYYDKAIRAARHSIQLAPDLAEGYSALGFALFNGQLDAKAAATPYQRSYELGFGNAEILSAYANFAGRVGRFAEGREAIARAEKLDPLNASVFRNGGFLEYSARNYPAAESQFRSALSINPKARNVKSALGDIALLRGDAAAAKGLYEAEGDEASHWRGLAMAERKLGNAEAAERNYAELQRTGGDTVHYQQAQVLAQWGRIDDALTQLEEALAQRDAGLVRLRNDPLLDPLRKESRLAEIERRIGFA